MILGIDKIGPITITTELDCEEVTTTITVEGE